MSAMEEIDELEFKEVIIPGRKMMKQSTKAPSFLLRERGIQEIKRSKSIPEEVEIEAESSSSEIISDESSVLL